MNTKTVIHIVDDDMSFRKAISRLLAAHGYTVVTHESAEEYLACKVADRGCLLLDVRMPGIGGLQAQALLARRTDLLPIIFLTGHGDIPMSVRAIKAGAEDFLTKPVPGKRLLAAIEAALKRYDEMRTRQQLLNELVKRFADLTSREREVFWAVIAGKLNKVIAAELGTVERTVKAHRHKVMVKMNASSLAELVNMGQQLNKGVQDAQGGASNTDARK